MKIYLNGNLVEATDAKISVFDRGYLFGEGLFETLRVYNGHIPFLDKHLKRMEWSATFLGISMPHPREIKDAVQKTIEANGLTEARVKILLSAEGKSFVPVMVGDDPKINLVIICEDYRVHIKMDYEEGVDLAILHSIRSDGTPTSTFKSTSWLSKMIARREFLERDTFDGILMDANGFVTECTAGNLFWIQSKKVYTTPVNIGLLPGITRQLVIDLVKENGYEFKETMIKSNELLKADEIFMTNSLVEVLPVYEIDGEAIGNGEVGPITKVLMQAYKERIDEEIKG